MQILLGYGVIINNIRLFEPRKLFSLFKLDEREEYRDLITEMDNDGLFDILAYAENIGIEHVLKKIADKSEIVDYVYTGTNHSLLFRSRIPWEVTQELANLGERDIVDEIEYIVKPYLVEGYELNYSYINLEYT